MGTGGSSYGARSFPDYSAEDFHHDPGNVTSNCPVQDYSNRQVCTHHPRCTDFYIIMSTACGCIATG